MTLKAVLRLDLGVVAGDETNAARFLRSALPKPEWQILRQLAMEVTLLGESEAAGQLVLVVPANRPGAVEEAASALRLRPAGEGPR